MAGARVGTVLAGLRAGLCAGLLACASLGPAQAQPTPFAEARDNFWWGDFAALEKQYGEIVRTNPRTSSGVPHLQRFRRGIDSVAEGNAKLTDAYFLEQENLTLGWARANPRSPLAHVLHAWALLARGWAFRGTGYANSVPPQAWADFHRHVRRATDYLMAHADVALSDSSGHERLLAIGRVAGWDRARIWAIARDGLSRNPDDDELYLQAARALLPKWNGDAVQLDRYIQDASEHAHARHGPSMYARLYALASYEQFEHQLFQESGADWSRMKVGFEHLVMRWPDADNHNRFAYFACLAKDKPAFLDQLEKLGPRPALDFWGGNARRTFETCKRWAQQQ